MKEIMSDEVTLDGAAARFVAMTPAQRQIFLTAYAHALTITAREHFAEGNCEGARLCNETLHRVVGYLGALLCDPMVVVKASFMETLVAGAIQRGWSALLLRALRMSVQTNAN